MLSVLLGPTSEVAETLVRHEGVEVLAFTGSVAIGKQIAATAGYKKLVLELGGNDPLIVLNDADIELAVTLAAEGSFRNSGQRCTAVKRILVEEKIAPLFTSRLTSKAEEYICGDPFDESTRVGTVIDAAAAAYLEDVLEEAVVTGAKVLTGGDCHGALFQPTVIAAGSYTFVGMVHPATRIELTGETIVRRCLTIRGVYNYAPRHLERAVAFLEKNLDAHPWTTLISKAFPLGELKAAFDAARTQHWQRVAVRP